MKNLEVGALGKGEKVMELVCGSQLERFENFFKTKQDLRWSMEERSNFSLMCGVMIYL